jgi:hypothetical protein
MATKYWVGGDGNWSSVTNWRTTSGGAVITTAPGSTDAAVLDANSSTSVVTLDISPTIQTLTCTGFTGTLAFGTNTISLNSTGTIFTGATTMTVTGTPLIICTGTPSVGRTITPTAVTETNSISFRITGGIGSLGITSGGNVRDLDFTDGVNPTGFGGALNSAGMSVYGNFKASTNMTQSAGTGTITFAATSGTKTITTAAVVFDRPFTFNGVGGTWQLQDALTSGATRTVTLTNGTLDLNGYTLTTGLFNSSNSNTRTLAFGTGKIVVTGTNATVYTTTTATGLIFTGTPIVEITGNGLAGETRNVNGPQISSGGSISNSPSFYIKSGVDSVGLGTVARGIRTLDFTGFSGSIATNAAPQIYNNLVLSTGMTVTGGTNAWTFAATTSQTITTNGKTIDNPITFDGVGGTWTIQDALTLGSTQTLTLTNGTLKLAAGTTSTVGSFATSGTNQKYLQSSTDGTQATISDASGTNSVSYLTIQDSNATGGAIFQAFTSNQNVDAGNNTGWVFQGTVIGGSGNSPTFGFGFRI